MHDLRGEFLRGVGTATRDTGSGADVAGTHQNGPVQPFCAGISNENDCWITSGNYDIVTNPDKTNGDSKKWVMAQSDAYPFPNNGRNINSFVSRPTNTSVLYCIKYKKIV